MAADLRATVLVVDDDAAVAQTLARMLRAAGYRVATALDAESGWRAFEAARPDAVLLDLNMPIVDGLALLRRLRLFETGKRTPVAMVTGNYFIDGAIVRELQTLGAVVHLKPLWCDDLVVIVERLLSRQD